MQSSHTTTGVIIKYWIEWVIAIQLAIAFQRKQCSETSRVSTLWASSRVLYFDERSPRFFSNAKMMVVQTRSANIWLVYLLLMPSHSEMHANTLHLYLCVRTWIKWLVQLATKTNHVHDVLNLFQGHIAMRLHKN